MSEKVLACRIEGNDVYFLKRPRPGQPDGLVKKPDGEFEVEFWSFISRFSDIDFVDNTPYLRELWFGNTNSETWQNEYLHHRPAPGEM